MKAECWFNMVYLITLNAIVNIHSVQLYCVDGNALLIWKVEQTNYYQYSVQLDRSRFSIRVIQTGFF